MIPALAGLLLCQLVGETIARAAARPLPGPVLGMVILFAVLLRPTRVALAVSLIRRLVG